MRYKKPALFAMSVILALVISPGLAFAASSTSSDTNLAAGTAAKSESTLATQAKTKVVYVVTKKTETFHYGSGEDQYTSSVYGFSYKKNGLMAKRSNPYGNPTTWSYKHGDISKIVSNNATTTFKMKNGKRVSGKCVKSGGYYDKATETYQYKGDKMTKCTSTEYSTSSDGNAHKSTQTISFTYNKKGLPVKKKRASGSISTVENFQYDSHGNVIKRSSGNTATIFENSYNEQGLLQKTTIREWDYTYEYKKIKVNSSLAKAIKAQQWTIANPDFSFGLYGINMP